MAVEDRVKERQAESTAVPLGARLAVAPADKPNLSPPSDSYHPHLVDGTYSIRDLVDIRRLEGILTSFSLATGFTVTLREYPSQEILLASGWRDICSRFHLAFPGSAQLCKKSNVELTEQLEKLQQPSVRRCANGLMVGATPIFIQGVHIANLATGQVLFEEPDMEHFREQAELHGYDVEQYLAALSQVPIVKEEQFHQALSFLNELAMMVAELGLTNLKQKRTATELQEEVKERRRVEQALRHSEHRFRELFDNINSGVAVYQAVNDGLDFVFHDFNKAGERIEKISREELLGKRVTEVFPGVKDFGILDVFHRVWQTGRPEQKPISMYRDDRVASWRENYVYKLPTGEIVAVYDDITKRKQAEEALRESEERYRRLVRQVPAVVYQGYPDWSLDCFDRKIEEITGYPKEDFDSRRLTWGDLILEEDVPQTKKALLKSLKTDGFYISEHRIRRKNGDIVWIQARNQLVTNPTSGRIESISGVFFDITERKRLEKQLLQAQKMEAVGLLAGGLTHDFNNLLTAIMGYGDFLLMDLPHDSPYYPYVEEIQKAAHRGESLTRQLLAFSRKQILQPQVFSLNAVVRDMDQMLRRLIGEDLDLVTIMSPELGAVRADPGQIEQVIMNLAVNARDAMPQGGKLTLETGNVYLGENYQRRHFKVTPGSYVMLAVSDNGEGMDPETQTRIFEPFFTTKEKGVGTGLGLATVYGIVRQSNGFIWVYSEVNRGTTFKVYLPRVDWIEDLAKPRPTAPTASLAGSETILLVEDDDALRVVISKALRRYGYKVWEAGLGEQALEICSRQTEKIQLLLTDVVMPNMSGRVLAQRLVEQYPDLKVLYMSGYTENAIVHHGTLDAQVNFIQKPFKVRTLARRVRQVLDSNQ